MNTSYSLIVLAVSAVLSIAPVAHADGRAQANTFERLYASQCWQHLHNLGELRQKLASAPRLPPEKAALFLNGKPGDAWPIPTDEGHFVLALPEGGNFCAVFARRADTRLVKESFVDLVAEAPAPLLSRKVRDERRMTRPNGETHTVAYEWYAPDAPVAMWFTLSTAPREDASIQALGSAALVTR